MSAFGTDFLYPFIDGDRYDSTALLADLAASADAKASESARLRDAAIDALAPALERCAAAVAQRLSAGGTLFAFGNGGSSADAASTAALFSRPPAGRPLRARSLTVDTATLTALANDVGYDLVFSRQLIAHARPGDVAVAISTSGNSTNLLHAIHEAARRRMLTVGVSGYDGGQMAVAPGLDHLLVVRSDSVHRIQEVQAELLYTLWSMVQRCLGAAT